MSQGPRSHLSRPSDRGPMGTPIVEVLTCLESEPETTNPPNPHQAWIRGSFIFIPRNTPLKKSIRNFPRTDSVHAGNVQPTSWASIPCPKSWYYHRGCSRPSRLDTPRSRGVFGPSGRFREKPWRGSTGGSHGCFAWNVKLFFHKGEYGYSKCSNELKTEFHRLILVKKN